MKNLQYFLFSILIMLSGSGAIAGELRDLMDSSSKQLLTEIQKNKEFYEQNREKLHKLVRKEVAPYFFFKYMSRFAAGRYWRKMNEQQQQQYQDLFEQFLIGTYSSAILNFQYPNISFEDEKPGHKENRFILTMYVKKEGDKVRVDYEIAKTKKGPKVINVKIEGVSFLINYRKSFSDILSKKGVEALIDFLKDAIAKQKEKEA